MKKTSAWLWGLVLMALGVILGVNALGIAHINIFFSGWWTLFIIIPCLISLFTEERKGGALAGLIIGVLLLLACLDVVPFGIMWKLILPAGLILVGLVVIVHSMENGDVSDRIREARRKQSAARRKSQHIAEGEVVAEEDGSKKNDHDEEDEDEDDENLENYQSYWSTFSDQKIDYSDKEFTGCRLDSVFGGIDLDLRDAKVQDEAIIRASSVFGGITIYVPDDVKVEVASSAVFGGLNDKRSRKNKDAKKTLFVDATCIFGGVEIR